MCGSLVRPAPLRCSRDHDCTLSAPANVARRAGSFAISETAMRITVDWFAGHGLDRPGVIDLFTAIGSGIAAQQNSNEPGGDR